MLVSRKGEQRMTYVIRTQHILAMIEEAMRIARECNGSLSGSEIKELGPPVLGSYIGQSYARPEQALEQAETLLLHAAAELRAERMAAKGWPQP